MTTPVGARIWYGLVFVALLAATSGCDKPVIATAGEAVSSGGIEFTVKDYSIRYLELTGQSETFEYSRPVLAIPVSMKNVGEDAFVYSPTHRTQQMTEASTPLLSLDPGPEVDLVKATRTPISGVYLEKGAMSSQISETQSVQPGDSIEDVFLFEVPPQAAPLVFSIPPSMHRDKMPILVRMQFTPRQAEGPRVHELNEGVNVEGKEFTVTGAEIAYLKMKDSSQGDGFSTEPLFKVSVKITNNGEDEISYEPGHRELAGRRGAALYSGESAYSRVRFPASVSPEGQTQGRATIAAGESHEDFIVFEIPGKEVQAVTLEYPANLFGESALIRVNIPFTHKIPEQPEEMKAKK